MSSQGGTTYLRPSMSWQQSSRPDSSAMPGGSAPSDVMEPFSYRPLKEPGEVRLLRINRREKGSKDPLQCILGQTTLDKRTKFSALSYCWDVHLKSNPIIVNGKVMHITESLATALDSLASSHHHVVVWADAICINQMDAVEKTQQVQMMGKIYSAAERVVIWLGPSTTETRYTVRELGRLGDRLIGAGLWDLSQEDILNWNVTDDDNSKSAVTKRKILEMATEHETQARNDEYPFWWIMSNLGKRKWFSRIWCIQELTNARTAIFRCGEDEVEFTRVWATALYFKLYVNRIRSDPDFDTKMFWKADWLANILSDALPTTIIGIRRRYLTSGALDLKNLLNRVLVTDSSSNGIDASDPRDRVYALLGLASDAAAQDIIADYTLSCEEAYINTARALLRHGHDDVLSLCRFRNKNSNLPSWVPDWTAEIRKPWSTWHTNTRLFHAGKGSKAFTTSNDKSQRLLSNRQIFLEGVIVDTIKHVGHAFEQGLNDSVDWTKLKDYFSDIASYLSSSNMYTYQQKEEAEWRIPVGDTEVSDATHQTKRASPDSDMKVGFAMAKAMANKSVPPEEIEKAFLPLACFQCQLERMYDSRPFISQSGYVGLGPLESQPGDTIIIFLGAQVPYILRQNLQNSAWKLIGESHVYGIMDGEFMLSNPISEHILLV